MRRSPKKKLESISGVRLTTPGQVNHHQFHKYNDEKKPSSVVKATQFVAFHKGLPTNSAVTSLSPLLRIVVARYQHPRSMEQGSRSFAHIPHTLFVPTFRSEQTFEDPFRSDPPRICGSVWTSSCVAPVGLGTRVTRGSRRHCVNRAQTETIIQTDTIHRQTFTHLTATHPHLAQGCDHFFGTLLTEDVGCQGSRAAGTGYWESVTLHTHILTTLAHSSS